MKKISVAFAIVLTGAVAVCAASWPGAAKAKAQAQVDWNKQVKEVPWSEENYGVDVRTTATASRFITGRGVMARADIEKRLKGYLLGKRMYILATSLNNKPLTSTAEYVLDTNAMTLSAGSERPTEKLLHLKDNPYVSLQYHKNHAFPDTVSLQVRGKATVFRGPFCKEGTGPTQEQKLMEVYDGPEVPVPCEEVDPPPEVKRFLELYAYQYMPWMEINAKNVIMTIPALLIGFVIERMMMNTMDIVVIRIDQAVIHDQSFAEEGYNTRQLWVRER